MASSDFFNGRLFKLSSVIDSIFSIKLFVFEYSELLYAERLKTENFDSTNVSGNKAEKTSL